MDKGSFWHWSVGKQPGMFMRAVRVFGCTDVAYRCGTPCYVTREDECDEIMNALEWNMGVFEGDIGKPGDLDPVIEYIFNLVRVFISEICFKWDFSVGSSAVPNDGMVFTSCAAN